MEPLRVGIVGTGNISGIYLRKLREFRSTDVVAVADLDIERAKAKAEENGVPKAVSTDELLADPEVELVLNLTIPAAHHDVGMAALDAGKHLYNEKPLTNERDQAKALLTKGEEKGLLVGCAPDTVLGAGIQTARKAIDDGLIGEPVGANAFMMCPGHESWHPSPVFYYKPGGGPMFDMGPYYTTALFQLLGPIHTVAGMTRISFPQRTITSEPMKGTTIDVETPTHLVTTLGFASGAIAQLTTSFDVQAHTMPNIEVYGKEGSLKVPDPNTFGGQVMIRRKGEQEWSELPHAFGFPENSRGLGVMDMGYAIRTGRPHRATGAVAYHLLDAMHAIHESSDEGRHIELESYVERPDPMPASVEDIDLAN